MSARGSSFSSPTDPTYSLAGVAAASPLAPPAHLLTRVATAAMSGSISLLPSPPTRCAHSLGSRSSPVPAPATRSPPSILLRTSAVPPPATCPPPSIGSRTSAVPSRAVLKLGDRSAPPSAPHLSSGLQRALSSPAQHQPLRRFSSDQKKPPPATQLDLQDDCLLPEEKKSVSQEERFSSDQKKPPPLSQIALQDEYLLSQDKKWVSQEAEWVELTKHLENHSLVEDATQNHLNMEVEGFGDGRKYNFSEDTGVPLFQSLVLLALANNNRGYCIKRSFTKDNLLVCPRLNQLKLKSVIWEELKPGLNDCNRAASYAAVGLLIRELLKDNVGPDAIRQLLEEPRDLLSKLERPSDERLITYHPAFLSIDGRLWFYEKLYRLVFKILPLNEKWSDKSNIAVCDMAYTSGNRLVSDIIRSHPLLTHIESRSPDETAQHAKQLTNRLLGRKVVALQRHTIEHAFDKDAQEIPSNQASRDTLWPYSLREVVDFLRSIMPLHLVKAQENFLSTGLWHHLNIDSFWARDLAWIGGVPEPSSTEEKAIKRVSYGKSRLQARKYD